MALGGTLASAQPGTTVSAHCCNFAPAHWNIVAAAPIGNSDEEQTGTVGLEQFGTVASGPGAEHSGNSLLERSGRILLAPSYTLPLEHWCTLVEAHLNIVDEERCWSPSCIVVWGKKLTENKFDKHCVLHI